MGRQKADYGSDLTIYNIGLLDIGEWTHLCFEIKMYICLKRMSIYSCL